MDNAEFERVKTRHGAEIERDGEMRELHVATSPLTNTIYAGHVLKDGRRWGDGKQDVTGEACAAVCMHVMAKGRPVVVTRNGEPKWEITVRELAQQQPDPPATPPMQAG